MPDLVTVSRVLDFDAVELCDRGVNDMNYRDHPAKKHAVSHYTPSSPRERMNSEPVYWAKLPRCDGVYMTSNVVFLIPYNKNGNKHQRGM
jgi:hypothetical protein